MVSPTPSIVLHQISSLHFVIEVHHIFAAVKKQICWTPLKLEWQYWIFNDIQLPAMVLTSCSQFSVLPQVGDIVVVTSS